MVFCDHRSIADVTGIAHFTALEVLNCTSNQLMSLDVSKNTALIYKTVRVDLDGGEYIEPEFDKNLLLY